MYDTIDRCRACGSEALDQALDLGPLALADWLARADDPVQRAPLELLLCRVCTLVQLRHTVDRDALYHDGYGYRSGLQEAMVAALRDVVADVMRRVDLHPGDVVLDIGANDGTLLRQYPEGLDKVAYEPCMSFWPDLRGDIHLKDRYFPSSAWVRAHAGAVRPRAKAITSCAMFYDVSDLDDFCEAIHDSLAPGGVWINQLAYLPTTLAAGNFGDIVHEHVTYWTGQAFTRLIARHGLALESVSLNSVNGGSVRFVVRHAGEVRVPVPMHDRITLPAFADFATRIRRNTAEMLQFLSVARTMGYGASTKANTYLQVWGVGPGLLPAIAERNPAKVGRYTVTGIPIISEDEARARRPDYFLALPYQFIDSFREREAAFEARGGRFVVPFPMPTVVGGVYADVSTRRAA